MGATAYYRNKILDHMLRGQAFAPPTAVYVSLHTGAPDDRGSLEVAGGDYAREPVRFGNPAEGLIENTEGVEWPNMPKVNVSHVGLWDAATGGNLLWSGQQAPARALLDGDAYRIPAFALTVEIG